jgi:hypothetical protein
MAIQVTGSFQLQNGTYAENPQLWLNPNLPYKGVLNLQTQVAIQRSGSSPYPSPQPTPTVQYFVVDNIYYNNINLDILPTSSMENPYDALIDSLNNYVVDILEVEQPNCTYNVLV